MRRVYLLQWGQCVAHDKVPSLWAAKIFSKGVPLCGSKKQTQTLFAACGGNHLGCPAHHWGFFPVPKLFAGGSPFLQRLPRRVIGKREPRKPGGRILLSGNLPCPWTSLCVGFRRHLPKGGSSPLRRRSLPGQMVEYRRTAWQRGWQPLGNGGKSKLHSNAPFQFQCSPSLLLGTSILLQRVFFFPSPCRLPFGWHTRV